MKKLGIIILVILFFAVGGLWYLGGQTNVQPVTSTGNSTTKTNPLEPARRPGNWEQELVDGLGIKQAGATENDRVAALVIDALNKKQNPLLPVDILPAPRAKTYQLSDLQLSDLGDKATITSYGQKLAEIISAYHAPALGVEIKLLLGIVERGETQNLPGLITAAERYQTTINQLLNLAAPPSAGQLQLNLLNTTVRLAENARLMTQIMEEPAVALGAAQLQTGNLKPFLGAIGNLNLFFAAQNTEFITSNNTITVIEP